MLPADVDELRELRDQAERGARRIDVRPSGWRWISPPDDQADELQGDDAAPLHDCPTGAAA